MANITLLVISLLLLLAGMVQVVWPYKIAANKERWDAIRSPGQDSEAEPKGWMVKYMGLGGVILIEIGILLLLLSIGSI